MEASALEGIGRGRDPARARGVVLVLLAGVAFSTAGIIVRLLEDASGWQILFYRSAGMLPTLLLIMTLRRRAGIVQVFRAAGVTAVVGGLCLALGFSCFIFGLLHASVANVLFILSAAPFLAALLGWLILGETVLRRTWGSMALAVLGVALMVGQSFGTGALAGNLFALLAVLGFSGFTIALRWGRGVDMMPAVCFAGLFAMLLAAVASGGDLALGTRDLVLCLLLGALQLSVGLALYTVGSRHVSAAELPLLSLTEVVLGPIWVWIGAGETPTAPTLLGGGIVLGAVAMQALGEVRRPRPPVTMG